MDYTFENRCEFPEDSVGKLILCKEGKRILLYGNMRSAEELRQKELPEAREWLQNHCTQTDSNGYPLIDGTTGYHKDIDHEGRVLGGTQAVRKGNTLCMFGESSKYGSIHPEAVGRCLGSEGLTIEHELLTLFGELPSLEEYLDREGKE